jgi:hypothetical protein
MSVGPELRTELTELEQRQDLAVVALLVRGAPIAPTDSAA